MVDFVVCLKEHCVFTNIATLILRKYVNIRNVFEKSPIVEVSRNFEYKTYNFLANYS